MDDSMSQNYPKTEKKTNYGLMVADMPLYWQKNNI